MGTRGVAVGEHVGGVGGAPVDVAAIEPAEIVVVDVIFDHGAAARAAAELRRSAAALTELLHERARARNALLAIWAGPAADQNARVFARTQADGHNLADRLRWKAGDIEDAAHAARSEQRRREEDATAQQLAAAGLAW